MLWLIPGCSSCKPMSTRERPLGRFLELWGLREIHVGVEVLRCCCPGDTVWEDKGGTRWEAGEALQDPTDRVVALSVFEAFANVENMTPEILEILFSKSGDMKLSKRLQSPQSPPSQAPSYGENNEEVDCSDRESSLNDSDVPECLRESTGPRRDTEDSPFLIQISLNNISDKKIHAPARLQPFKLLGALINCLEGEFSSSFI
ncbi:uncharacterized protein LOC107046425 [Diachasma alloeum]|uniref:uncharacterized protein LOC107046425 n=1 Tax=Diachasma alloeum TaxID=454923 RepID=UPI0007383458|nr:uncharacterized protein LOC107046425 [Diachasma alloeum]